MSDYISACYEARYEKFINYRTPSGRWSAKRELVESEVLDSTHFHNFMSAKFPGERREYSYNREGYLPRRVTVPNPYDNYRYIYEFEYGDKGTLAR